MKHGALILVSFLLASVFSVKAAQVGFTVDAGVSYNLNRVSSPELVFSQSSHQDLSFASPMISPGILVKREESNQFFQARIIIDRTSTMTHIYLDDLNGWTRKEKSKYSLGAALECGLLPDKYFFNRLGFGGTIGLQILQPAASLIEKTQIRYAVYIAHRFFSEFGKKFMWWEPLPLFGTEHLG